MTNRLKAGTFRSTEDGSVVIMILEHRADTGIYNQGLFYVHLKSNFGADRFIKKVKEDVILRMFPVVLDESKIKYGGGSND